MGTFGEASCQGWAGSSRGFAARAVAIEVAATLRKGAAEGVSFGRTPATTDSSGSPGVVAIARASASFAIAER